MRRSISACRRALLANSSSATARCCASAVRASCASIRTRNIAPPALQRRSVREQRASPVRRHSDLWDPPRPNRRLPRAGAARGMRMRGPRSLSSVHSDHRPQSFSLWTGHGRELSLTPTTDLRKTKDTFTQLLRSRFEQQIQASSSYYTIRCHKLVPSPERRRTRRSRSRYTALPQYHGAL